MVAITIAIVATIGFALAAWWTSRDREPTPGEIEQVEAECMEDTGWSDQDEDDFTEYFGQFGEFYLTSPKSVL